MKVIYNKFHWPEKNFKPKKPNLYYLNEIFYCPIFLYRKVFLSLDDEDKKQYIANTISTTKNIKLDN